MTCQVDCDSVGKLYDVWRDSEFVTSAYICPRCAASLRSEGYILEEVISDDAGRVDCMGVGGEEKVQQRVGKESVGSKT